MAVNATITMEMPMWWPENVSVGYFFFILGLAGAAIMVYLGSWDKLLGNSARILELEKEIKSFRKELKEEADDSQKEFIREWINSQRKQLNREKTFSQIAGIIIYLFVGGVVATILADNLLEAITFGAGWTGLIGIFGIKADAEKRRNEVDMEDARNADIIEGKIGKAQDKIKMDISNKIEVAQANIKKEYGEKITDAYLEGYADGIEAVAKVRNEDSKALTKEVTANL
ncbi:hypothetical protein V7O66_01895 [Methanolobus sp. ZRKC3]|uniref:hypothetical protein n=1 Tax=Methanolobus sp. ZRKC3 TaxID=3125786 RepID=UPI003255F5E1